MYIKYIGDGGNVKVYTFSQYEFLYDEWVKVDNEDGENILKNYSGFVKKLSKKEEKENGIINK